MPVRKRKAKPAAKPFSDDEKKAKKILAQRKPLSEAEEKFILQHYGNKHKLGRRPDMLDELKRKYGKIK